MPRQPRTDFVGAIHHVTARGNNKHPIFRDDADNWVFTEMLGAVCESHGLAAIAWCLMGNHFHVVIHSRSGRLSSAMHWLTLRYARRYNTRYRHSGHVFQGRYHSMLVNRDAYLLEVVRYVLLNPVRARLCDTATEWRWSSAREMLGLRPKPDWTDFSLIHALLGGGGDDPVQRLASFLRATESGACYRVSITR